MGLHACCPEKKTLNVDCTIIGPYNTEKKMFLPFIFFCKGKKKNHLDQFFLNSILNKANIKSIPNYSICKDQNIVCVVYHQN